MLIFTESAQKAMRRFIKGNATPVAGLRIAVQGGGCSGLQYDISLAETGRSDDTVVEASGFKVFIDAHSAPLLQGVTVDFQDSLASSGFKFSNPNAEHSCGCGKSFSA